MPSHDGRAVGIALALGAAPDTSLAQDARRHQLVLAALTGNTATGET
jgi:hypothetical protein